MDRIDIAFVGLKIIALVVVLDSEDVIFPCGEKLVVGKKRRTAGTQVGEDHTRGLAKRIGGMANLIFMLASPGFAWLVQTAAADIVEPSMIDAPETAVLQAAVAQIGAAVRAVEAKEPGLSGFIAK
jgi:hypothetical protein